MLADIPTVHMTDPKQQEDSVRTVGVVADTDRAREGSKTTRSFSKESRSIGRHSNSVHDRSKRTGTLSKDRRCAGRHSNST